MWQNSFKSFGHWGRKKQSVCIPFTFFPEFFRNRIYGNFVFYSLVRDTVCPRCLVNFYIGTPYIEIEKTSWTYSIPRTSSKMYLFHFPDYLTAFDNHNHSVSRIIRYCSLLFAGKPRAQKSDEWASKTQQDITALHHSIKDSQQHSRVTQSINNSNCWNVRKVMFIFIQ